jgi:hypothetical protein
MACWLALSVGEAGAGGGVAVVSGALLQPATVARTAAAATARLGRMPVGRLIGRSGGRDVHVWSRTEVRDDEALARIRRSAGDRIDRPVTGRGHIQGT